MVSPTDVIKSFWDESIPEEITERIDQLGFEVNEWGYDDLGLNVEWLARAATLGQFLYRHYFRMQSHDLDEIPDGPALIVGNHSSQMAYDGMLILMALLLECDPPQFAAPLGAYVFAKNPFYSEFMPRLGQLTGTPDNCDLLLERGRKVLVFPEGENGGGKTLFNRYKLEPFGKGFMRIAYRSGVPVVPFAFIGGEEMVPSFSRMKPLAKRMGMKYFPLSPTGMFPLPTKCSVQFGSAMEFSGDPGDAEQLTADVNTVENEVRRLSQEGLKRRTGVFL